MATEDDVRLLALALPATTEKPSYGTPGFRVRDRLFARIREERDVLVVWCEGLEDKELLITSDPAILHDAPLRRPPDRSRPPARRGRHRARRAP